MNERCDVLVVGAGPAGIAAATTAAENGAHVLMIDEGTAPGGQIWRAATRVRRTRRAEGWVARLERSGAVVRGESSVVDVVRSDDGFGVLVESGPSARWVRAARVVLATGARERFLPFPGWILPNVVGIGGAQALLKSGTSFAGRRIVIAGTGPLMFPVAASLSGAGARVLIVAEQAPLGQVASFGISLLQTPRRLGEAAGYRSRFLGARYLTGAWVTAAQGDGRLESVTLSYRGALRTVECDTLCTGFGLVPNTELARLVGCATRNGAVVVDAMQTTSVAGVYCAGEPTGIGGVDQALIEGEIAGLAAAGGLVSTRLARRHAKIRRSAAALERAFALRPELERLADAGTIVCRCEDVRLRELDPRWTSRQAKLYTRAGMGPCQGRICGAALECLMGWAPDSVRPPVQPARLSTLLREPGAD